MQTGAASSTVAVRLFEGRALEIKIKDTGCGIENVEQARKPMFTTGDDSRSGMGFTIMEGFTDRLRVRSAPGRGTVVTMTKVLREREDSHRAHDGAAAPCIRRRPWSRERARLGKQRTHPYHRAAVFRGAARSRTICISLPVSASSRRCAALTLRAGTSLRLMPFPRLPGRSAVFCAMTARSRSAVRSRNARCVCAGCRASWRAGSAVPRASVSLARPPAR